MTDHPLSQGQCEGSNRVLKQRIRFASTRREGFNWAEELASIANEINTSVSKTIRYLTPFEAYHGKSHVSIN
jgi:hypothetical protein